MQTLLTPCSLSLVRGTLLAFALAAQAYANPFFVDAASGSDTNTGLNGSPWRTLQKALATAPGGTTVLVAPGDYGAVSETSNAGRTDWITLQASSDVKPQISSLQISYPSRASAFLKVQGFKIFNTGRGGSIVSFKNVANFQLVNSDISADKYAKASSTPGTPFLFDGISGESSSEVLISRNRISSVFRGISVSGSSNVTVSGNFITPQSGSGIQHLGGNSNFVIDGNHIHGQDFVPYPADPDAMKDPHASLISVRSSNLTISGNILHGMGSSAGIMFYDPDVVGGEAAYSNITIENNLIYDVFNSQVLRIYNLGDNVVIRNNLVAGQNRVDTTTCDGITNDARYRYNTALVVHRVAAGRDGSGLKLYNNIFVGLVAPGPAPVDANNIIWSYQSGSTWLARTASGTSKIITSSFMGCGKHSKYFESGFFAQPTTFAPQHRQHQTFEYFPNSEAIGFAAASFQPESSLPELTTSGFLGTPLKRVGGRSVGPYEPGAVSATETPPSAPEMTVE